MQEINESFAGNLAVTKNAQLQRDKDLQGLGDLAGGSKKLAGNLGSFTGNLAVTKAAQLQRENTYKVWETLQEDQKKPAGNLGSFTGNLAVTKAAQLQRDKDLQGLGDLAGGSKKTCRKSRKF